MISKPGIVLLLGLACGLTAVGLSAVHSTANSASGPSETVHLESLTAAGLPNLHRLSKRLYSGGQPEGRTGFRSLAALGIRTVITVDGAEPDIASASQAGLRYVHLPIGYDGIPRNRQIELYAAVHDLPGPIYIHCHHGLHRGPAAAVAVCQMDGGLSAETATDLLKELGTAAKYAGLYRDVQAATPPGVQEMQSVDASRLPQTVAVPPLTHQMVELDHAFAAWTIQVSKIESWTPALQAEATQLAELLIESGRTSGGSPSEELRTQLRNDGEWLMRAADHPEESPAQLTKAIKLRCDTCHARFRDL